MDNASSPEPNETEAQEQAAPPVEQADDEATESPKAATAGGGAGGGTSNGQNIASPTAEKKWYIVNTYSGHENKAKLTLLERVKTHNLTEYFGDVLVPTESVTENVKGQRRTTTRKFFPGYMFVQMVLDDRTFHLVKNTPKITGFLGGMKPTPVPPNQIQGVQTNITEGKAGKTKARVSFEAGENVRVVEGPFANFSAKVVEVKTDKQKLKVSLSMLGRATLVELDFAQVEKA
jgi:transcription termination/antitermination protein NusG